MKVSQMQKEKGERRKGEKVGKVTVINNNKNMNKIFGPERNEAGENCIMRTSIINTLYQILLL
jgi:hypothetical protein